ncbi:unnamed protein product [Lampetra fluviatilis]
MRHFRAFGSGAGSLKRVARSPSASAEISETPLLSSAAEDKTIRGVRPEPPRTRDDDSGESVGRDLVDSEL